MVEQAYRTNRTGAELKFQITGTHVVGLDFGTAYQANLSNEPNVRAQVPRFVWRWYPSTQGAARPSWSKPRSASGRQILADAVDASGTFVFEIKALEPGAVIQTTDRNHLRKTERFREPEEGLPSQYGGSADPVEGFGPAGRFMEIIGIVCDPSSTITTPADLHDDDLNVVVYGDYHNDGRMVDDSSLVESRQTQISDATLKTYVNLALRGAANFLQPKRNLSVANLSWDGQVAYRFRFPATLDGTYRYSGTDAFKAGFATDPDTGAQLQAPEWQSFPGFLVTDTYNTDGPGGNGPMGPAMDDKLTETRSLSGSFTPDVAIIDLASGTQEYPFIDATFATILAEDVVDLIESIRARWSSALIVVVGPYREFGVKYPSLMDANVLIDPVQDGLQVAVAALEGVTIPADEIEFIDMLAAVDSAPGELGTFETLLTESQHAYLASTLQSAVETLLDTPTFNPGAPSFDFSVTSNSQYVATL